MNKNSIISLAMLYALWETKHKDLLDLIQPFILYSIESTTRLKGEIVPSAICSAMNDEFGYKNFPPAVVTRALSRMTSSSVITRFNKKYYLTKSLSEINDAFRNKRIQCKAHTDAVTKQLTTYLNSNTVLHRSNYTEPEASHFLLSFFESYGSSIVLSVDDLRQIKSRNNEINYFVGKFILLQKEGQTVLFDYIIELVQGYFVSTAIYLQADNPNISEASFRNVTFYLDTRILLAFLGYKTQEENMSVQEMVRSLKRSGAKLSCFDYNIDEVDSILEAYKQSCLTKGRKSSSITLEYFDEHHSSASLVDAAQRLFLRRLTDAGIVPQSFSRALEEFKVSEKIAGLLDDEEMKLSVLSLKPSYNLSTLSDDLSAINTISRIRNGQKYPHVEKCRSVFVTTNTILVVAVKEYLKKASCDVGFPLAITVDDMSVIAWLKNTEQNSSLPKLRLLENTIAAISPNKELMDAYFETLGVLEQQGKISSDEVSLLKVDLYARRTLMEMTYGEKSNVTYTTIDEIRERIRAESTSAGYSKGREDEKRQQEKEFIDQKNRVCARIEIEIEDRYINLERKWVNAIQIIAGCCAGLFAVATVFSFIQQWENIQIPSIILTIVSLTQGLPPFFSKDSLIIKLVKQWLSDRKLAVIDTEKAKYLDLIYRDRP